MKLSKILLMFLVLIIVSCTNDITSNINNVIDENDKVTIGLDYEVELFNSNVVSRAGYSTYLLGGGFGGNGGSEFDWVPKQNYRISAIYIWSDYRINGIQIVYRNYLDGHAFTYGTAGTQTGNLKFLILNDDEVISDISGRYGNELDNIRIELNSGRFINCGGSGGWPFEIDLGGRELLSIKGRSGNRIDKIYFYSANDISSISRETIGPFGGAGGYQFIWFKYSDFISELSIRQGSIVDGFSVNYKNFNDSINDYRLTSGGNGGHEIKIIFNYTDIFREYIIGIAGSWTNYGGTYVVQGLAFEIGKFDNQGKLISTRKVSTGLGENGTYHFNVDVPKGKVILGFFGAGARFLDNLGFYIYDLPDF